MDTLAYTREDETNGLDYVNFLVTKLQQILENPALQGEVIQQLRGRGILSKALEERVPSRPPGEISKKGTSLGEKENTHEEHPRSESPSNSSRDVAPRRRRQQRSNTPPKRRRSPSRSPSHDAKRERRTYKRRREKKRSPSSPSSSSSSSSSDSLSSEKPKRRGHRRSYAAWKRSQKLKKVQRGRKENLFPHI